MLNVSPVELPHGIHSGLRRERCHGLFFYFQAPRSEGWGKRHFWRYIDARTQEVTENRFEIARQIACLPDEPRYIGDQDVFALQERVIEQILGSDREIEAKAAAARLVDPIQQIVAEVIKASIRRGTVDRSVAKQCLEFLGQPMGVALHHDLKRKYEQWSQGHDDQTLLASIATLSAEYSKNRRSGTTSELIREQLELICFQHVTG